MSKKFATFVLSLTLFICITSGIEEVKNIYDENSQATLFRNVGTGLCIQASNALDFDASFLMGECPSPGTSLDKLIVVKQEKSGAMLISPFVMGTETVERCALTGFAEGDKIFTHRCNIYNPWHGWDFQNLGNNQFLLKHRFSGRCAKPISNNAGTLIGTYRACNANDNNMKWERF